ncbi:hypothetical protein [Microbacterium sp.]|uniref:lactate/malate family dehydrogenase n=1 Tax=Microbacterium sp. TaxID=51671 RepID=UPI000A993F18|nr:hypothetical protein [Microbacterium sp.]MBN9189709.1 hypothetical protein [Microbacterium sp.]MBN9193921.1 hypothetical protein [Microbacterium sp.]
MRENPMVDANRSSGWRARRVAILGASGLTGSGLAHNLAQNDAVDEVILFDLKENVLQAHIVDMKEAQIVTGRTATRLVRGSLDRVHECGEVDLVVVAASLPETPDGDRGAFLDGNLGVLRSLTPAIESLAGQGGLVMLLTNPADLLATAMSRMSAIDPGRIFGYCLNDSVRFAAAVSRELRVDPSLVDALVLGEHGDGQVPVYSALRVSGELVSLTATQRARIDDDVRGWFRRWSQLRPGRSSGWTTPLGAVKTIELLSSGRSVPVAVWTGSIEDLPDAHVTLPAIVDAERVVPDPSNPSWDERDLVRAAAESLASRAPAVLL